MKGILIAKFEGLIRRPGLFLVTTMMSIVFAVIFGSMTMEKIEVPTFIAGETPVSALLEENDVFAFTEVESMDELKQKVRELKAEFGVILSADYFELMVGVNSSSGMIVEQMLESAYVEVKQRESIGLAIDTSLPPVFTMNTVFFNSEEGVIYNDNLFRLFGFTMFFVMYTIAYSVLQILTEKRSGIWDRMILSSVGKWKMYTGNFIYSFLIGYMQVLVVFSLFKFVFHIDFNGAFWQTLLLLIPYVLAIVSLFIFVTSIVKTIQQYNALVPVISVSIAMLGGAYWPLEIVEADIMLLLAKVNPIYYGIEALEGVAIYEMSLIDVLYPVSVLLLMSVVLTGMGIHLMERRHIK